MTYPTTASDVQGAAVSDAAAVHVEGITVSFGSTVVLDEVSLSVPKGTITAVVGPSGCGKTTLLRTIAGLEPINSGRIEIGGTVVADTATPAAAPSDAAGQSDGAQADSNDKRGKRIDIATERRSFGLVPQEGALFPHMSVQGNIAFGLGAWWQRWRNNDAAARVTELLDVIGLTELRKRRPATLSGGQRQRVALARALAPRPAVIGLDEPFSALDVELRVRLREHVRQAILAEGASGLLVTHDREEAMAMADVIVVLIGGRVRQIGPPNEVYLSPVDAEVAQLFGDVVLADAVANGESATGDLGALELRTPARGAGTIVMRPGDLELDYQSERHAEITSIRHRGDDVLVTAVVVGAGGRELLLRAEPEWSGAVGDSIGYRQRRPVHFLPRA